MITNLHIKNIGIIDDIEIDFNKGLNVLTGETGAGKTLIIDSLQIISGGRFSKEMIRKGETNSFVEMCIFEPKSPLSIDGNIIISREINLNGRNMCKINGRMVTVNELKEFMKKFIEIHGQNDNQILLEESQHQKYLDEFIGKEINKLKEEYLNYYLEYNKIKKALKENFGDDKERQRKIDLLKYQLKEIEIAKLDPGEEEELQEKRKLMLNSEKIVNSLNEANNAIGENAIDLISNTIRALEKIESFDEKYRQTNTNLKNIYYELQELSRDISGYKEQTYFEESEREYIETRLDTIFSLKRKYGNSIEEILNYKDDLAKEIDRIENLEEYNNKLKENLKEVSQSLETYAKKMHVIREKGAKELSKKINESLKELEMKNAKINIHVDYMDEEIFDNGKDKIIFYICTNFGEDEKHLSKIASGGEMSRIMLAIKTAIATSDDVGVMVFDEIDTGISGKAANSVAEKLHSISKMHQVLCISHLPNIAAYADYNYFINKKVLNERTQTGIKLLNEEEVLEEIARISSGEVNETTIKYATELRNRKIAS